MNNGGPFSIDGSGIPRSETNQHSESVTQKDVDDYRDLGIKEAHLLSMKFGDIYIVLERSNPRRFEILPEEVKLLANACRMFDAQIVKVRSPLQETP